MARCGACNKKLSLLPIKCKCGGEYCAEHRPAEAHGCTYNYREEVSAVLLAGPVVADKMGGQRV
jgi:predicted nucleic acid binding AN1-type Zn finger protein